MGLNLSLPIYLLVGLILLVAGLFMTVVNKIKA